MVLDNCSYLIRPCRPQKAIKTVFGDIAVYSLQFGIFHLLNCRCRVSNNDICIRVNLRGWRVYY